uniref:Uncharacterized protein n=1 Tax=Arundo donax TaxID=35708 RepID=A0A0A9CAN2_ARUDO
MRFCSNFELGLSFPVVVDWI